ncbi:MAG TPA: PQQ-binding-like beta-propeller repeat protein [Vicinamibacteria bacterium]|nr:PQQ-binding-like beta-propeller repeat protein [Vicinamibacteria bacterium]
MHVLALALLLSQTIEDRGATLREAVRRGDIAEVQRLIDEGADVDAMNRYQATALFFAADKGDLPLVRLLVEKGARIDVRDTFYQMSPLGRALDKEHDDVVLYLLERGASEADAVLSEAVRRESRELLEAALASGRVSREGYDEATAAAPVSLRALIESRPRPPPSLASWQPTRDELQPLTGKYVREDTGEVSEVELSQGGLLLRSEGKAEALHPSNPRSFVTDEGASVVFGGRGGMVERLVVNGVSHRPLEETESREPATESADVIEPLGATNLDPVKRGQPAPWPAFRGGDRSGIADGQGIPLEWDAASRRNIRWKTAVPGFSVASPIIYGARIFVLTAVSGAGDKTFRTGLYGDVAPVEDVSEHRWLLLALDAGDGIVVWERELHRGVPGTKRHTKSSQANATPVTNGKQVVTVLGSTGQIFCHDFEGNLLWKKDIGVLNAGWFYDPDYQWGHSSSPILYENTVIVQADVHGGSFVAAYDVDTGREVWRTPREDEIPTFATPTVFRGETGDELVTNGTVVRGYDPKTGELLWHLAPNSEIPIGSPVVTDELIYVTAGYPPIRPIYAIRPGSRGDLGVDKTESLAWSLDRGGTYIPTPLVYRGFFYTNANNGRLSCYDARTGTLVYRERIGGVGGSYAASPIASDGRLYFTNEEGETFVVEAGPEYRLLAKNSVDGLVLSTPAASDGLLVIRTLEHVYGIAE